MHVQSRQATSVGFLLQHLATTADTARCCLHRLTTVDCWSHTASSMWVQRSGALGVRQRRAVHQRQRIYLLDTGTGVDPSQTLWGSNSAKSFSIVSLSFPCPSSSLLLLLFPATKRPLKYRGIPLCECCKLHHWCLRTNMRVNTITTQFYPLFNITEHYSRLPSKHIYTGRRKKEKTMTTGKILHRVRDADPTGPTWCEPVGLLGYIPAISHNYTDVCHVTLRIYSFDPDTEEVSFVFLYL